MNDADLTRYVRTPDGLALAYQVFGAGERDIVLVPMVHAIDVMWDEPAYAAVLDRLARMGRVVCLDYKGFGASDPLPLGALPTPESWMEDTRVVLDAIGSTQAHVVSHGSAAFCGMLFAAIYPERTSTLTIINGSARVREAEDYPQGTPAPVLDGFVDFAASAWGTGRMASIFGPSRARDEAFVRWSARFERAAMSPTPYRAVLRWAFGLDLRDVLPSIRVPTLVVHREGTVADVEQGRYLAAHIPDAQLVVLPGDDYWFFTGDADELFDRVEEFITGATPVVEPERALTTVLFTDIVSSTSHAAREGDRAWKRILDQHDALTARELVRHGGRKVNTTGDGMLAMFDGPARAVRCARAICDGADGLGLEIRAGLHTGEVERRGEDISGIAVHIGQRISALAGPGEVLVSRTVTDLVAGSGLCFAARGEHPLKGLPGEWPVFALEPSA